MTESTTLLRYAVLVEASHVPSWATPVLEAMAQSPILNLVTCLHIGQEKSEVLDEKIKELKLDFILALGHFPIAPIWCSSPTHGLWRFRFGDELDYQKMGIHEISRQHIIQQVDLEKVTSPTMRVVLKRGTFKIHFRSLDYHRTSIIERCARWPTQVAESLLKVPVSTFEEAQRPASQVRMRHVVLAHLISMFNRFLTLYKRIKRQFYYQQWNIGTIRKPLHEVALGELPSIDWWPAPSYPNCLADPFTIDVDGSTHLLVERFSNVSHKGSIEAFSLKTDGLPIQSNVSLMRSHHLSYPCAVNYQGKIFSTFENIEKTDISIYQCIVFPNEWINHSKIVTGEAHSDPTLFFYDDLWWVFATRYDSISQGNSILSGWYAQDLKGPWLPHAQNPIKCDVSSARGAGRPFNHEGITYRPAQNCSEEYGRSVAINVIKKLTPDEFHEVCLREITPDPKSLYPKGLHHLTGAGEFTFIDGRRDIFNPTIVFEKILQFLFLRERKAPIFIRRLFEYCYFQSWNHGLWVPDDRKFLIKEILPHYLKDSSRMLFVGVHSYTKNYGNNYPHQFETLDRDPKQSRYGASKHHIADLRTFVHTPYEVVVVSGVIGFGLNDLDQVSEAVESLARLVGPGGTLILGTNPETFSDEMLRLFHRQFTPSSFSPTGLTLHSFFFPLSSAQHDYRFFKNKG